MISRPARRATPPATGAAAARWSDAGRLLDAEGVAPAGGRGEVEAAAPLVLGTETRHHGTLAVHHHAGEVGRLLRGGARLDIDAVAHARGEDAALGVEAQIQRLQQDRDRLGRRLDDPAIFDGERERPFAPGDRFRQIEADA